MFDRWPRASPQSPGWTGLRPRGAGLPDALASGGRGVARIARTQGCASWCGWSGRLLGRRVKRAQSWVWPATRCSPTSTTPTSPTWPAPRCCWRTPTDLPAVRHPQRRHDRGDPANGRGRFQNGGSSCSACTAWAKASVPRGPMAHWPPAGARLRAGGRAPRPLLAYLVRRLLENGANSSSCTSSADADGRRRGAAGPPLVPPPSRPTDAARPVRHRPRHRRRSRRARRAAPLQAAVAANASSSRCATPAPPGWTAPAAAPAAPQAFPAPGRRRHAGDRTRCRLRKRAADARRAPAEFLRPARGRGPARRWATRGRSARGGRLPAATTPTRPVAAPGAVTLPARPASRRAAAAGPRRVRLHQPVELPCWPSSPARWSPRWCGNAVIAKPASRRRLAAAAVALLHEAGVPRRALPSRAGRDSRRRAGGARAHRRRGVLHRLHSRWPRHINRTLAAKDGPIVPA